MSGTVPPLSLYGFMAWRGTAVLSVYSFGLKFLPDDLKERPDVLLRCMQCGFLLLPTETVTSVKSELSEGTNYLAPTVL